MYEFSNEPDLGGISWQQYLGFWNAHIPVLRKINSNAAYIGPVLGVFANFDGYVVPWLAGCKASGVLPNGVSYHIYPCTGTQWTASTCMPRSTSFSSAFTHADTSIVGVLGHTLPHCLTEWNIDADAPVHSFAKDPNFVPQWTKQALDDMAKAGFAMACQWDAGGNAGGGDDDLINTNTFQPNSNGQYQAFAERVKFYMGGTMPIPTPVPVPTPIPTPTPTPTGLTPLSLSYSTIASSVLPTANKLLITNSGTPPSAQSYTTFGTLTGFVEVLASGGLATPTTSISAPSGHGFILEPSTLNLTGQTIPAGDWSCIVRLNAAQGVNHPQSGQLMADLYERAWKYSITDGTYTHIATLWKAQESLTPAFTNYPLSMSTVPDVSFGENETLYIDVPADITANSNNNPQQGIRFNRLATTAMGDPFGTLTTPGYQATAQPTPVSPTPPTVTLADTGIAPGTYEAVIDYSSTTPGSIPITLIITS